jgi:hypothetical protein
MACALTQGSCRPLGLTPEDLPPPEASAGIILGAGVAAAIWIFASNIGTLTADDRRNMLRAAVGMVGTGMLLVGVCRATEWGWCKEMGL